MEQDRNILQLVAAFEECFEEVVASHELKLTIAVAESTSLWGLLEQARTLCLPIQEEIDASACMLCDHFIGCRRTADGSMLIECWSHRRRTREVH